MVYRSGLTGQVRSGRSGQVWEVKSGRSGQVWQERSGLGGQVWQICQKPQIDPQKLVLTSKKLFLATMMDTLLNSQKAQNG